MKQIEKISGIRCNLFIDCNVVKIFPFEDEREVVITDGNYILINEDLGGGLYSALGNEIYIENFEVKSYNFQYISNKHLNSSVKVIIFKASDICNLHDYNDIRSYVIKVINDFSERRILQLLDRIEKCPESNQNELLLFLKCCLLSRLNKFDEFQLVLQKYIALGFSCFEKQLILLNKIGSSSGTESNNILVLHHENLNGAFEYSVNQIDQTEYIRENKLDDIISKYGNKNKSFECLFLVGHGRKEKNKKDEIEINDYIIIERIFKTLYDHKIKCKLVIVISCWTNQLDDPIQYDIKKAIYHRDKLDAIILKMFTKFSIESLNHFSNVENIYDYIKLSMFLYTPNNNNLGEAPT